MLYKKVDMHKQNYISTYFLFASEFYSFIRQLICSNITILVHVSWYLLNKSFHSEVNMHYKKYTSLKFLFTFENSFITAVYMHKQIKNNTNT